ncbi:MAG TPA: sigma-70 family RNA polymerase sigma factor [Acetivibrio clariflavus]|nr:sigma-70 family RNA polymerase sigma factor [Acetivibrio clariflavus]HPU42350.1 sigma-70 family RNA polymerase sigma factor [Acetivibrio clariflavus]
MDKKITVNTCINFKRDIRNKVSELSINSNVDESDRALEKIIPDSELTEDKVMYFDTKKALEDSIKELPDEIRMAVLLRHINGLSYNEIAELMSCPVGTIKTYLFRGRRLLKESLVKKGIWEM